MPMRETPGAGDMLLAHFVANGAERVETSVLQPADVFVDLSGEEIRRRLFLTQDSAGRELCLRPEYTIPVCRRHVASGRARAQYCYLGPVFRHRDEGGSEFLQVGIESLGRPDLCPADADVLGVAIEGYELAYGDGAEVRLGDMGLLGAVLAGLEMPAPARRRLIRALAGGKGPAAALEPEAGPAPAPEYAGLLAAIQGQDARAARAFVEDVLSISGVARIGGRSAAEIADRFLSKAENRSGDLPERTRAVLSRYLSTEGGLDEAARTLRQLARDERLDLAGALDLFEERTGFIDARGIDLGRIRFSAAFARTLDYYTGFIFEIRDAGQAWQAGPAGAASSYRAAGGRYDRLLAHLGAPDPVPAVGCSFWFDRPGEGGS